MTVAAPPPHTTPAKGLRAGALGRRATLIIGVGSTAPAYSLAASLGLVAVPMGRYAPAALLLSFLPMFFVAVAYAAMNRRHPDCGTTFAWVGRALGPTAGWIGGFSILVADLLVMASLAQIAGVYSFKLLGWEAAARSTPAVAAVGVAWIAGMTWVCNRGIQFTARTQAVLLVFEILALVGLAGAAVYAAATAPQPGSMLPSVAWMNPFAVPPGALHEGLLLSIFIYWGWDSAVSVNEETRDAHRTPGLAAVASTLLLVVVYVLSAAGAQAFRGPEYLAAHADDVLSALGTDLLGPPWDRLILLSVLLSTAACTQTTILPTARTCLSMASAKAIPAVFGRVHGKNQIPHVATLWFGVVSSAWYVGLLALSENLLAASIPALGLVIAFYLGLSSLACPLMHGRELFRSPRTFIVAGLLPSLGALAFAWVFIAGLVDVIGKGPTLFGLHIGVLATVILYALGIACMWAWKRKNTGYF